MAVDINEPVRTWGGFTVQEFKRGLYVLGGLVVFSLVVLQLTDVWIAMIFFAAAAVPFVGFWVYQRDLPRGYLARRWRMEGRFFFVHWPNQKATDVFLPPSHFRESHFEKALKELDHAEG